MKKHVITLIIIISISTIAYAQISLNDFGRIILNSHLPSSLPVPNEAKNLLETKLKEIATINGLGGSDFNPRFIITANINIGTKDIIAGAPAKMSQRISLTLFIGDAISNTVFSSTTLNLIGVGDNENKSFIEAFNSINPRSNSIKELIEEGKNKIISYYLNQCEFISKNVETLISKQQYDEAIYTLALVPEVCKDCYIQSQDKIQTVYKQKIDYEGAVLFSKAKSIWMSAPNSKSADNIRTLINNINHRAACYPEIAPFVKQIQAKVLADEKQQWQFDMKQYTDNLEREKKEYADKVEIEKQRLETCRQIAVEYAKNQPKTINYSYIIW
jgi:hypothetical protein